MGRTSRRGRVRGRLVASIVLAVLGLAIAAFFGLLLAVADCGAACVARGERAVALAFVSVGFGMLVYAASYRLSQYRAVAWGLLLAGLVAAASIGWIVLRDGARGLAVWALVAALVVAAVGGWMRFAIRDGAPV